MVVPSEPHERRPRKEVSSIPVPVSHETCDLARASILTY